MNEFAFSRLILILCFAVASIEPGAFGKWPSRAYAQGLQSSEPFKVSGSLSTPRHLKLLWAPISSRPEKSKKKDIAVGSKTDVTVRLTVIRVISKQSVAIVERNRAKAVKPVLVRSEPRREKKIKSRRTVFKPWFRALMDSLSISGYVVDDLLKPLSGNDVDEQINQLGANLELSARTFIWRPWFAIFGAGIGLAAGRTDAVSYGSDYVNLVGNAKLMVFPTSRFPFEAEYDKSKSQVDYNRYGSVIDTEKFSVRQSYSSIGGTRYYGSYERTRIESKTEATTGFLGTRPLKDDMEIITFGASRAFENHNLNLNSQYTNVERLDTVESTENATVVGTHRYYPGGDFSVDNTISYYRDVDVALAGTDITRTDQFTELERDVFQLTSYSFWRPKSKPLTLNVGARYFATIFSRTVANEAVAIQSSKVENTSANLNAGLSYDVDKNLKLSSNVNINRNTTEDRETIISDQSLGLVYSSDDAKLLKATYNWQYAYTIFNSLGDDGNLLFMQTQLGHGLKKSFKVSGISKISFDISQNYSVFHYIEAGNESYKTPDNPTEERLTHAASISWSSTGGFGRATFRLAGTDTRNRGVAHREKGQVFQIGTFLAVIEGMISRYQRLLLDFNVQLINDNSTEDFSYESQTRSRGSLSYRHGRLFGVRNLRFTSEARIADESLVPSFGDDDEFETFSWENKLDYRIGKLELTGILRMAEVNSLTRHLAMIRAMRSFGR